MIVTIGILALHGSQVYSTLAHNSKSLEIVQIVALGLHLNYAWHELVGVILASMIVINVLYQGGLTVIIGVI